MTTQFLTGTVAGTGPRRRGATTLTSVGSDSLSLSKKAQVAGASERRLRVAGAQSRVEMVRVQRTLFTVHRKVADRAVTTVHPQLQTSSVQPMHPMRCDAMRCDASNRYWRRPPKAEGGPLLS